MDYPDYIILRIRLYYVPPGWGVWVLWIIRIILYYLLHCASGGKIGELFTHFSDAAQRAGVYTTYDYINILKSLLDDWKIDKITELTDKAEKARDYLMRLPDRLSRIAERTVIPEEKYQFTWMKA